MDKAQIMDAATNIDWEQVVANGGPPCFHVGTGGAFCLRAQRWPGHNSRAFHAYVPLFKALKIVAKEGA